ncbi:hypothetical protein BDAP_002066 [Binucleata daphniae]
MNLKRAQKTRAKKPQKQWHELELKAKSENRLCDTKPTEYKMPLVEKDTNKKNQKSIVDIIRDEEKKKLAVVPYNKDKKVMRISAQKAWERCQRASQIGKKATRKINKVSEKKYYVAEGNKK